VTSKKRKHIKKHETGEQGDKSGKPQREQPKKAKKGYSQIIFRDWCKKCGICSAFCPKNVIGQNEEGGPVFERPEDCIGCRFCELHCPDFAITIQESDHDSGGVE